MIINDLQKAVELQTLHRALPLCLSLIISVLFLFTSLSIISMNSRRALCLFLVRCFQLKFSADLSGCSPLIEPGGVGVL